MRKRILCILFCLGFLAATSIIRAQGEPKHDAAARREEPPTKAVTSLRVQVVFMEFDGDKKVSNLPYTLLVNADEKGPRAALRMGLRVPIQTSGGGENKQFTYLDIGTNLDGSATKTEDGRYSLQLNVERSSIYGSAPDQKASAYEGTHLSDATPVVLQFRSQVNLVLRDSQTMLSTVSTDPLTGRVLKVEVTLNVLKP